MLPFKNDQEIKNTSEQNFVCLDEFYNFFLFNETKTTNSPYDEKEAIHNIVETKDNKFPGSVQVLNNLNRGDSVSSSSKSNSNKDDNNFESSDSISDVDAGLDKFNNENVATKINNLGPSDDANFLRVMKVI